MRRPAVDRGRPHLAISLLSLRGCLMAPFPLAFLQYFPSPPSSAVSPLLHSPPVASLDWLEMPGPGLNWSCRLATGHGGRNAGFPRLARFPPNPVDPSGRHCRIVQWNSIQILSPTAPLSCRFLPSTLKICARESGGDWASRPVTASRRSSSPVMLDVSAPFIRRDMPYHRALPSSAALFKQQGDSPRERRRPQA